MTLFRDNVGVSDKASMFFRFLSRFERLGIDGEVQANAKLKEVLFGVYVLYLTVGNILPWIPGLYDLYLNSWPTASR